MMLKALPVKNPEQLYLISHVGTRGISESSNFPLFEQLRDQNQVFDGLFAVNLNQWKVSVNGQTEVLVGQVVTGNYYSVLGVKTLGRPITVQDDRVRKGHPVAVISYSYWRRRFGLDPAVLGKTITINLTPFTIIGGHAA